MICSQDGCIMSGYNYLKVSFVSLSLIARALRVYVSVRLHHLCVHGCGVWTMCVYGCGVWTVCV